jgi:ABC-2 type transport system ATP-binding protein
MLNINNLFKSYNKDIVLDNISFSFEEGKIYGIIGDNGSGKTTLLNCIANRINYNGKILLDKETFDVSYVTSPPLLPEFLTPIELINFSLGEKYLNKLDDLKIKQDDQNKLIKNCSLGTISKVQFLIAVNSFDKILLLDEPFSNMDQNSRKKCETIIKNKKDNKIIIITSHDYDLIDKVCDDVLLLKNHKLKLISKKELIK